MKKNIIALFFMIDFSIQKLRLTALVTLLGLLPLPALASKVDIYRYRTDGDRVTLRVRVTDDNNLPIQGLAHQDFQIQTTDQQGNSVDPSTIKFNLIPPERQSHPDLAYVAILLDMSGSMKSNDAGGTPKLSGAIQAINKFIEQAKSYNIPLKISLVPFGTRGGNKCDYLYEVDQDTIEKNSPFEDITDERLQRKLKELSGIPVCAATDLYKPLEAATTYLRKQIDSNLDSEDTPKPRLAAILLSDGFDNSNGEQLRNLARRLKQPPQVTVHTLGYGESLRHLRDRAQCSRPFIPDDQLTPDTVSRYCHLPNQDINEFILDEDQLRGIATTTGGIYKLSANANEVAKSLTDFLTTLREYEIVYRQPGADRATLHQTTVQVNSPSGGLKNVVSNIKNIRISNFNYHQPSLSERLNILALTAMFGLAGVIPFIQWSKQLKQQAERNLEI